jgi:DNA-directed RNA polymerase subunit RPC12/RpoP
LTPGIEKMQAITCPSCGASADFGDAGICNHCNNTIVAGQMQWTIADRLIYKQYEFQVKGLGYYAEEQGTDLETNISGSLEKQAYKLAEINNQPQENRETWWRNFSNSFSKDIATKYFDQIYQAWSNNNLGPVRHLLTDRIFMSFMFWIDNYKQAHLQNKLEQIHVNKVEICKLQLDKNFVSITTRIHASCLDYTVDDKGEIYGGSNTVPRKFSEYWIFIRSQNNFNQSVEIQKCPSCGAEIDKMGQGAVCGYCNSKISTGNFSWVLSTIIQDEVYKPNM